MKETKEHILEMINKLKNDINTEDLDLIQAMEAAIKLQLYIQKLMEQDYE